MIFDDRMMFMLGALLGFMLCYLMFVLFFFVDYYFKKRNLEDFLTVNNLHNKLHDFEHDVNGVKRIIK